MKFTEAKLEEAIIALLGEQGFPHVTGDTLALWEQWSSCSVERFA